MDRRVGQPIGAHSGTLISPVVSTHSRSAPAGAPARSDRVLPRMVEGCGVARHDPSVPHGAAEHMTVVRCAPEPRTDASSAASAGARPRPGAVQRNGHDHGTPGRVAHDAPAIARRLQNPAARGCHDRHPDTRFILDHLGILQPRTPQARSPQPWADLPKVLDLARRKNVVIKVSGACTLSQKPYPFPDIWDPLARIFDAWGMQRCLWGTDWTRAFAVVNYEQAVEPFRLTDRLSKDEKAMLMGGACAKAYGWSPQT